MPMMHDDELMMSERGTSIIATTMATRGQV